MNFCCENKNCAKFLCSPCYSKLSLFNKVCPFCKALIKISYSSSEPEFLDLLTKKHLRQEIQEDVNFVSNDNVKPCTLDDQNSILCDYCDTDVLIFNDPSCIIGQCKSCGAKMCHECIRANGKSLIYDTFICHYCEFDQAKVVTNIWYTNIFSASGSHHSSCFLNLIVPSACLPQDCLPSDSEEEEEEEEEEDFYNNI